MVSRQIQKSSKAQHQQLTSSKILSNMRGIKALSPLGRKRWATKRMKRSLNRLVSRPKTSLITCLPRTHRMTYLDRFLLIRIFLTSKTRCLVYSLLNCSQVSHSQPLMETHLTRRRRLTSKSI
jgi:hypothetical protein